MIVNVPVYSGANNTTSTPQQGPQEYGNFLKRKNLESESNTENRIDSEKNNNNNDSFQQDLSDSQQNWKKRHLDNGTTTLTTYQNQPIFYSQNISETKKVTNLATAEAGQGALRIGDGEGDGDGDSYNIMTNSNFINDFLTYDANLLVPVTRNGNLAENLISSEESIFTTSPSTLCVNATAQFDDTSDHWQASDLLELDHRYNSSLQTEITQLNPTLPLKSTELPLNNLNNSSKPRETTFTTQANSNNNNNNFLIPARPENQHNRLTSSATGKNRTNFMTSQRDHETDFEDKNLLWLLNFKFDEFPHLSPDITGKTNRNFHLNAATTNNVYNSSAYPGNSSTSSASSTPLTSSSSMLLPNNSKSHTNFGISNRERSRSRSRSPKGSIKASKKFEELVMEVTSENDGNDMTITENTIIDESSIRSAKKPPFTYTELIEYALEDKGELTVSGIYQWISDRFPYYKSNDDRWKNSVRHNLSINPHFRKGVKAPQGAGHLWTISSGDSAENVLAWEHKKQRLDLFFKMESINRERLLQHQQQQEKHNQNCEHKQVNCQEDQSANCGIYDEAAIAAAVIQQDMMQRQQEQNLNSLSNSLQHSGSVTLDSPGVHVIQSLTYNDLLSDEELRKTAGQILNGIHREVEVQSVNHSIIGTYHDVLLDNEDYLNPIHKDVAVHESGLQHSLSSTSSAASQCATNSNHSSTQYYITEIDGMDLGGPMSQHNDNNTPTTEESDAALFNDEFNLNYFSYAAVNDTIS